MLILTVSLCFNNKGAYILDNGEYLNIYIFDQINSLFYSEIFEVESFYKIDRSEIKQLDENNTNELNVRIYNLINQFRQDNKGLNQPIRMYFLTEKDINKEELTSQMAEDSYLGEKFYVDFLAELHQKIQQKLS